jgi:hypothetical protein
MASQANRYPMNLIGIVLALAWIYFMFIIASGDLAALTQ